MAYTASLAIRNAQLNVYTTQAGSTSTIKIYNGTMPTNADTALAGNTLLVSLPCSAAFAPAASAGSITVNAITTTAVATGGTASFFRIVASDGTTVLGQGSVAVSGGDMNFAAGIIWNAGYNISESSFTISL